MAMSAEQIRLLDAYWRAANYLTVGQIYLRDNPLLREPLAPRHIKPRLLGHWGTSPGLSFVYVHLNRLVAETDADVIYLAGPGHGGPALVANVYLEGTYSEIYPDVSQDAAGLRRLFRQFSSPGGIPSHVSVPTPGSIHEGGELGYVLVHAFGAAFDNPELIVAAVVGDGEAETGPLAGSWTGVDFLNPARDGAVLPILHLNGYKIGGPTLLGRAGDDDIVSLLRGHGWEPVVVTGDDPVAMHPRFAQVLDDCHARIRAIQTESRRPGAGPGRAVRPRWPAIVLRTPKGWTGPKTVDGLPVEGTFRAHQVPVDRVREDPAHLAVLESWMRSYRPEALFDERGRLRPELAALAPKGGSAARGESPRQRRPPAPSARPARLRRLRAAGAAAGERAARLHPPAREVRARHLHAQPDRRQLPPLLPGRDELQPARRRVRGRAPVLPAPAPGRRRSRGARRPGDGDPE
jgi:xylulose-5-phosphate/fructose-6-phosphate phosphoketolase